MSQIKKLDNLIVRILKEELENSKIEDLKREIEDIKGNYDLGLLTDNERRRQLENIKRKYKSLMTVARLKGIDMNEEELDEERFAGKKSISQLRNNDSYKSLNPLGKKQAEDELTKGGSVTLENEKENGDQLDPEPTGTEIAGQVAEIVDKLKLMSEGSKDPKKQKLAARIMKQMEAAKATLEALTAHETMLEEKKQQEEEKDAQKHVKGFRKHLTKLVKEPVAVDKIAAKLTPQKMADLKRRLKSGELDEEKLARVMLQHSLQEGWVKKDSIKESAFTAEWMHIFNDLLDPDKIAHLAKHADFIKKTVLLLAGTNMAAKYLAQKSFNIFNKAKKPNDVKPQEVEKIKDEIEAVYNKAPQQQKKQFDSSIKNLEKEIAESSLK